MATVNPKKETFGACIRLQDWGGLNTKKPQELIADNQSPRLKNVVFDKNGTLEGIWGTSELLTISASGYNSTITNPIYALYPYNGADGVTRLIVQGVDASDSKMSLYYLEPKYGAYPYTGAPTRFYGSGSELTTYRRCCMATYKSRLYVTNGCNPLFYWDGSSTRVYHDDYEERFRYITPYARRLWMACSPANPSRVIYTDLNECNFYAYYSAGTNYFDFTTPHDDSPVMWIRPWQSGLLIFKVNSVILFTGSVDDPQFTILCENRGTVNGWSIQATENKLYFMGKDGFYLMGEPGLAVTADDQTVRTDRAVVRISSEIDNFFKDNFIIPDPSEVKEKVWSGTLLDSATYTTILTSNVIYRTAPITENPDVITFSLNAVGVSTAPSSNFSATPSFVSLRSTYGSDAYYSQSDALGATEKTIVSYIGLNVKAVGTMASTHKLNVYICAGNSDDTKPDFNKVYAEAQLTGASSYFATWELPFDGGTVEPAVGATINGQTSGAGGVISSVVLYYGSWAGSNATGSIYITSKTGTWQDGENIRVGTDVKAVTNTGATADASNIAGTYGCTLWFAPTYYDYPQNLLNGDTVHPPTFFIAVKPEGDTDSAYLQWGYTTSNAYTAGRMYNSDSGTPASQSDCDYCFALRCGETGFSGTGWFSTNTFDSGASATSGLTHWGRIFVGLNEDSIDSYTRNSKIEEIRYLTKTADSSWPSTQALWEANGTVVSNGGPIVGNSTVTDRYLRIYIKFTRPTSSSMENQDSFSLQYIKATYYTQAIEKTLVSSAIWEDRYYCSIQSIQENETGGGT